MSYPAECSANSQGQVINKFCSTPKIHLLPPKEKNFQAPHLLPYVNVAVKVKGRAIVAQYNVDCRHKGYVVLKYNTSGIHNLSEKDDLVMTVFSMLGLRRYMQTGNIIF